MVRLATGRPSLHIPLLLPGHLLYLAHPQIVPPAPPGRLRGPTADPGGIAVAEGDRGGAGDSRAEAVVDESGQALRGSAGSYGEGVWVLAGKTGAGTTGSTELRGGGRGGDCAHGRFLKICIF
jgi:hypothetical protein